MTISTTEVTGRVFFHPESITPKVKEKIGGVLDKTEGPCKEASKAVFFVTIPAIFDGIVALLTFFNVPASICKAISAYGTKKMMDACDPIADSCVKTTHKVAQQVLEKSAEASIRSSASVYSWLPSWLK